MQEPGVMEAEFAEIGVGRAVLELLSYRVPDPLYLPKGNLFGHPLDGPLDLPPWLSHQDANYYATQFEKTGITGALNYYRNSDRYIFTTRILYFNKNFNTNFVLIFIKDFFIMKIINNFHKI